MSQVPHKSLMNVSWPSILKVIYKMLTELSLESHYFHISRFHNHSNIGFAILSNIDENLPKRYS